MSLTVGCPIHQCVLILLFIPFHLVVVRFLQSDVHCGRVAGSNGSGKKFVRWEVMAMAKPPLRRHYCTSAQPLPLPIQRVGTNQPGDLRMMISGVEAGDEEHRLLHVGLSAGIKGLILAKHIGVINSRSACPIPQGASGA